MMRGLAWLGIGVTWACNVPLERFFGADAGADATLDASPSGGLAQQAYGKASNTGAGDSFGHSVALSADGSTLAVGAFHEASSGVSQANNAAMYAGAVYVFTRSGQAWSQQAYVKASNAEADDLFGDSVALSADGDTLAIGASSEDSLRTPDDNAAPAAGAAYVFIRSGTTWTQDAYLKASNAGPEDNFGRSIALSADGTTLAVGANGEDSGGNPGDDSAQDAGAAYVFTRTGASWNQQAYIKPSSAIAFDQFGTSVALSADGSILAVGASSEASPVTNVGKAYVFTRTDTTWSERFKLLSRSSEASGAFGNSVALSGDGATLAVGASREDSTTVAAMPTAAGAVYVFTGRGASWTLQADLEALRPGAGDNFGHSVALSADGSSLAVGAVSEDGATTGVDGDQTDDAAADAGAVYLLTRSGATWSQHAYVKASNTGPGDNFGHSVALSADGSILAAGASAEDSDATGINGDQASNAAENAGAVYLFR